MFPGSNSGQTHQAEVGLQISTLPTGLLPWPTGFLVLTPSFPHIFVLYLHHSVLLFPRLFPSPLCFKFITSLIPLLSPILTHISGASTYMHTQSAYPMESIPCFSYVLRDDHLELDNLLGSLFLEKMSCHF